MSMRRPATVIAPPRTSIGPRQLALVAQLAQRRRAGRRPRRARRGAASATPARAPASRAPATAGPVGVVVAGGADQPGHERLEPLAARPRRGRRPTSARRSASTGDTDAGWSVCGSWANQAASSSGDSRVLRRADGVVRSTMASRSGTAVGRGASDRTRRERRRRRVRGCRGGAAACAASSSASSSSSTSSGRQPGEGVLLGLDRGGASAAASRSARRGRPRRGRRRGARTAVAPRRARRAAARWPGPSTCHG